MAVASALNYNFRPQTRRFAGRRKMKKAENSVISSRFRPLSAYRHCIKDSVKIDVPRNMGNMLMYGQNDIIRTNFRNEVIL